MAVRPVLLRIEPGEQADHCRVGPRRRGAHLLEDHAARGQRVDARHVPVGRLLPELIDQNTDDAGARRFGRRAGDAEQGEDRRDADPVHGGEPSASPAAKPPPVRSSPLPITRHRHRNPVSRGWAAARSQYMTPAPGAPRRALRPPRLIRGPPFRRPRAPPPRSLCAPAGPAVRPCWRDAIPSAARDPSTGRSRVTTRRQR